MKNSFGSFFTRRKPLANTINVPAAATNYLQQHRLHVNLDEPIIQRIVSSINRNINAGHTEYGDAAMSRSMLVDLSRMNYFVNNKCISRPGDENGSYKKFMDAVSQTNLLWVKEYIASLSYFLHQGIFMDVFEAVHEWKASGGAPWKIKMVSLDRERSDNSFNIDDSGIIKITSQCHVKNIILENNDIILTNSHNSTFLMQLTLLMLKGKGKRGHIVNGHNFADHVELNLDCQGLM
jgi:hypothetical protein